MSLTSDQIEKGWLDTFSTNNPFCPCDLRSFTKAVNWAQHALASNKAAAVAVVESTQEIWEYSFIHSSALGRPDEKVGPCLTYNKDQAFGVGCIEQRLISISAPIASAEEAITQAAALAFIDQFEIVGDNNDSRDPTGEERFILREFILQLFDDTAAPAPITSASDAVRDLEERETDEYVIKRLSEILAGVAVALKGPELPLHRHGYQDLVDIANALKLELELYRANAVSPAPIASAEDAAPVPMLLFCPQCGTQHVDAPEPERLEAFDSGADVEYIRKPAWTNPPHRSHKCHACSCIWRPADVATTGVETIATVGKKDNWDGPPSVAAHPAAAQPSTATFQARVQPWMLECFGAEIAADRDERNHRLFEEAGELVQSRGMTREEAHALVDYTWGRPAGEPFQEVGGVMVTLAALCLANGLDMHASGDVELERINVPETIAKIRAKQAAKPKHSPLPTA